MDRVEIRGKMDVPNEQKNAHFIGNLERFSFIFKIR